MTTSKKSFGKSKSIEAQELAQDPRLPDGSKKIGEEWFVPAKIWERTNSNLRSVSAKLAKAKTADDGSWRAEMARSSQIRFTPDDVTIIRQVPTKDNGRKVTETLSYKNERARVLNKYKDTPYASQIPPELPHEFLVITGLLSKFIGPIKAMAEGKEILLHVHDVVEKDKQGRPKLREDGEKARTVKITSILSEAAQAYQRLMRDGEFKWLMDAIDEYAQSRNMLPSDLRSSLLGREPSAQSAQGIVQQAAVSQNGPAM